jgi:Type III restriction enzyme, res subunit
VTNVCLSIQTLDFASKVFFVINSKMSENLTPRLYQLEIVELAKKSNVVAYLDTGAGKTFISVLLLRCRQEAHATALAAALAAATPPPPPWKAIFLAPQVALVEQQAAVLARHLSARVRKLVGADIESWTGDAYISNWRQTLHELDILVATPQLVVDMLRHAVIPGLWMFDTLVFDEAHHCKGGHPYNRIMEYYRQPILQTTATTAAGGGATVDTTTATGSGLSSPHSFSFSKPRIFGMSAAPAGAGAAKSHLLPKNLALLEANMQCQVVTVADRSGVDAVVPQPELEIEEYQSGEALIEAIPKLNALREGIQRALARLDIAVALEQYVLLQFFFFFFFLPLGYKCKRCYSFSLNSSIFFSHYTGFAGLLVYKVQSVLPVHLMPITAHLIQVPLNLNYLD